MSSPLHSWPCSWAGKGPCHLCLSQCFLGSWFQMSLDAWWPVTHCVGFSRWRRASMSLLKLNTDAWGCTHQFSGTFSPQNWLWPKVYGPRYEPWWSTFAIHIHVLSETHTRRDGVQRSEPQRWVGITWWAELFLTQKGWVWTYSS